VIANCYYVSVLCPAHGLDNSRKVKTINKSFYHLKDSYGTTQLLVDHVEDTCYSVLSKIPVESTVLIEGVVALRPTEARKPVSLMN